MAIEIKKLDPEHLTTGELHAEAQVAFTELGAKTKTPKGIITLGSFAATYSRRVLPPHRGRKTE